MLWMYVKFIYSEKATKFCEISTLLLFVCTVDKSKVGISQIFVAFSEYTKFIEISFDISRGIIFCSETLNTFHLNLQIIFDIT